MDVPTAAGRHMGWKRSYRDEELVHVACPGCGFEAGTDIAHEFGLAIARCRRCGLVYTRTRVPDSQGHYAVARSAVEKKYGPILRRELDHPRAANYHEHLALLERHASGRKLLDVGCHCGFFLDVARSRGWEPVGVEPSPVNSALARERLGLDVHTGALEEVELPAGSFDVVTLIDVLEHLPNPAHVLDRVARLLKCGGRVFVKVPNVRYVIAKHRLLGRLALIDDAFDAREHLVHYSAVTLGQVLRTSGFEIEVMRVPEPIQAGAGWRRALRAAGPWLARALPYGVATPLATDIAVLARSPERGRAVEHADAD